MGKREENMKLNQTHVKFHFFCHVLPVGSDVCVRFARFCLQLFLGLLWVRACACDVVSCIGIRSNDIVTCTEPAARQSGEVNTQLNYRFAAEHSQRKFFSCHHQKKSMSARNIASCTNSIIFVQVLACNLYHIGILTEVFSPLSLRSVRTTPSSMNYKWHYESISSGHFISVRPKSAIVVGAVDVLATERMDA